MIENIQQKILQRLPRLFLKPAFQLSTLGLVSWLFYYHLASSYPMESLVARNLVNDFGRINNYSPAAMYDYLFSMAIPFVAYLIAWRILHKHTFSRGLLLIVFLFALLFAGTLVTMYPIGASDLFDYVFYSRIFVHYGQNPLSVAPINFRSDPFFHTVVWYKTPSPYGPLWLLLTVPGSLIAGDNFTLNLLLMDALPAFFYLASGVVIALILRHSDPGHVLAGTLLYAWNPLVLFEGPGNGHNGIIMMFFVLVAIYLLVRKQWIWVLPALFASVLVKYISAILILPFLIYCWRSQPNRQSQWRYLGITSGISFLLVAVIAFPFFSIPVGLLDEANWYSLLAVPTLAFHYLNETFGEKDAKTIIIAASSVVYLILYFASLKYIPVESKPRRLVLLCTWLTAVYLTIACVYFQPWFIKWLVALGIWANHTIVRRVILAFTASGLLSYVVSFYWVWNWNYWGKMQTNSIFVAVIFGPPVLIGIVSLAWRALPLIRARLGREPISAQA